MNQFKSIWGLMLEILLLGVNRPRKPGYPHNGLFILKAHEDKDKADYYRDLKAQGSKVD